MSGAEPWIGSYRPLLFASSEAEGSMPIEPVSIDASSDRMSPNMLPVTITSNCLGLRTSCIAQLSTYMWDSSTSRNCFDSSVTISLQSREVSSTFALSTEQTFFAALARRLESDARDAADLGLACSAWCRSLRARRLRAARMPFGWPK